MCVCWGGVPDDYKGLGLVDHMSSGDRRVCAASVYRRKSACLSIHVNTSKMPEGANVCCLCGSGKKKKQETLNEMTDAFDELAFKSSVGFKLNVPV